MDPVVALIFTIIGIVFLVAVTVLMFVRIAKISKVLKANGEKLFKKNSL